MRNLKYMALMATHIRFALEKREEYGANDMREYISGSMYPDSRYFTGIDRALTHPTRFSGQSIIELGDFEKGWYAHLVCDLAQGRAIKNLFVKEVEGLQTTDDQWGVRTAIKALQDIEDARAFDVRAYVAMAVSDKTPNGERVEDMGAYYALFRQLYARDVLTYQEEFSVWEKVGMAELAVRRAEELAEKMWNDSTARERVTKLFSRTLQFAPAFEKDFFLG